jgi:hypothetical protein
MVWRRARADGSYASANDPRVLIGLGPRPPQSVTVRVVWPSGNVAEWTGLTPGRYVTLAEGTGAPVRTSDTARPGRNTQNGTGFHQN